MTRTVLIAGASGALGNRVVRLLAADGWRVRALTRNAERLAALGTAAAECIEWNPRRPRALDAALDGVDAVFSCLGASVLPMPGKGWRGFLGVDLPVNRALIAAAGRARVKKVTYVSTFHREEMRRLRYVAAHEGVVDAPAHLRVELVGGTANRILFGRWRFFGARAARATAAIRPRWGAHQSDSR